MEKDFQLDVEKIKSDGGVEPASTSNLCWGVSTAVVSSIVTGCTGECLSTNCPTESGCSQNTCTCYC